MRPHTTTFTSLHTRPTQNEGWDQILYEIWPQYEQSQNESFRRSLLTIVKYLCEDSAYVFENQDATNPSISQAHILIPRLINVVTVSQAPAEVELALTAVYNLMAYKSEMASSPVYLACGQYFPQLLESWERCLSLAEQQAAAAGQLLPTTLDCYRLSLYYYDQLKQSNKLDAILQLMYRYATPGYVPTPVALKACEFWMDLVGHSELVAANPDHATSAVQGLLEKDLIPGLVKLLLDNMCFSDAEVSEIMEEEQADQVKPKWINEEDDAVEQWTLRTCSAQTLDNLAQKISHAVVNPPGKAAGWLLNEEVLPRLISDDWKKQESAMLALGCISKGCTEVVVPSLARLVPEMLTLVKDETRHFLMRSITLWTLGRYMEWVSQSPLCEATLLTLLEGMTAPRRKVQEGSVSSFAELMLWENKVKGLLTQHPEYLEPVFHKVSVCLQPGNYTIRNLVMLLDACRSIIAAFGETMQEKIDACILKPMIECHFMNLPADDKTLFPHIACCILHSFPIMPAIFPKYAEKVFRKCIDVTGQHFRDSLHFAQTGQEVPNTDVGAWLVMSIMKMIVGLVYEQDKAFADNLVLNIKFEGSNYNFIDFVLMPFTQADICLEPTYVTEAENFIGDYLTVYPERLIEPMLGNLTQLLSYISVSDNLANDTSWLCGELVLSMQGRFTDEQIHQATKQMANKVVPVLLVCNDNHDVVISNNTRNCSNAHRTTFTTTTTRGRTLRLPSASGAPSVPTCLPTSCTPFSSRL